MKNIYHLLCNVRIIMYFIQSNAWMNKYDVSWYLCDVYKSFDLERFSTILESYHINTQLYYIGIITKTFTICFFVNRTIKININKQCVPSEQLSYIIQLTIYMDCKISYCLIFRFILLLRTRFPRTKNTLGPSNPFYWCILIGIWSFVAGCRVYVWTKMVWRIVVFRQKFSSDSIQSSIDKSCIRISRLQLQFDCVSLWECIKHHRCTNRRSDRAHNMRAKIIDFTFSKTQLNIIRQLSIV